MRKSTLSFENSLMTSVILAGIVPWLTLLLVFWLNDYPFALSALLLVLLMTNLLYFAWSARQKVKNQINTTANLLESIQSNDYTLRGHLPERFENGANGDTMANLTWQINQLSDSLSQQRLQAKESQMLLGKVVNNIDIAIFAVNNSNTISMANNAFLKMLGKSQDEETFVLGKTIEQLDITHLVNAENDTTIENPTNMTQGRFLVYCDTFVEQSEQHRLFLLKDASKLLRREESEAWQKLIRVISHEINNSLAPISSMSESLKSLVHKEGRETDIEDGLEIIQTRSTSLIKLLRGYQSLAKLPPPVPKQEDLKWIIEKICLLHQKIAIEFKQTSEVLVNVDRSQIEQVLINLVKNANESQRAIHTENNLPAIEIEITTTSDEAIINIKDQGTGIRNVENIFTPFYTTKSKGSGVGLLVSRQIVEAHGGTLQLQNRQDKQGGIATITLPKIFV